LFRNSQARMCPSLDVGSQVVNQNRTLILKDLLVQAFKDR